MTLEELRLRIAAAFPTETVQEKSYPDGTACFSFGEPLGCLQVFWWPDGWQPWAGPRELEARLGHAILSVTAHQLIAARRRLAESADAH